MKLAFLINSLEAGGAERSLSLLANKLHEGGHTVHVYLLCDASTHQHFSLHPQIKLHHLALRIKNLSFFHSLKAFFQIPAFLSKTFQQETFDAVISFMDQANILLCLTKLAPQTKRVICEQIHPAYSSLVDDSKSPPFRFCARLSREWAYRRADTLVLLSEQSRAYFSRRLQKKICIIPNPVAAPSFSPERSQVFPAPFLLALGRLVPQKDFPTLMHAFALLANEFPEHQLVIGGEGPCRAELESLRDRLGLTSRMHLPGLLASPGPYIEESQCFVLSSRFEGFPLALGEAMSLGKAVIASDCLTGPADMIEHGKSGLLFPVGDVQALAEHLRYLLCDKPLREQLGEAARERMKKFSVERVAQEWEHLVLKNVYT